MIQQKRKLCNNCNIEQFIWKNDKGNQYCKSCWYKSMEIKTPLKAKKSLNLKSKRMQTTDAAYSILRKKFMEQKPMCEAKLHCCNGPSTDVHHKKGRGKYHLEVSTWLSVCRSCHSYIEEHPVDAIELGLSNSRH